MSVPRVISRPIQLGDKVLTVAPPIQQVKNLFLTTGIQPADTYAHNVIRVLMILAVIAIIAWNVVEENVERIYIEELEPYIKKGSILYQSIEEMDDDTQQKYLILIKKKIIENKTTTKAEKYLKNLKVSLIAGLFSEYMINGDMSKPLATIARTIFYSVVYTTISM